MKILNRLLFEEAGMSLDQIDEFEARLRRYDGPKPEDEMLAIYLKAMKYLANVDWAKATATIFGQLFGST